LIRCGLVHDATWPEKVVISRLGELKMEFGYSNGVFTLPDNYVKMLPYIIIGAPENKGFNFGKKYLITVGTNQIDLNEYWGRVDDLIAEVNKSR